MRKLKLFSLIVKDQDAAVRFYTEKLGFELMEDLAFGKQRWITLALPGNKDVSINVNQAATPADEALIGAQGGSVPLLGLQTNDCMGDYRRMKALGVEFEGEPQSGPWGTGVTLRDLYGNKLFLNQEPA